MASLLRYTIVTLQRRMPTPTSMDWIRERQLPMVTGMRSGTPLQVPRWRRNTAGLLRIFSVMQRRLTLAQGAADKDEIARRTHEALTNGDLIIDPIQDARYYRGRTWIPSPYDYDRNHIYEGPPDAPAATGYPSPASGINPRSYYGSYVGGQRDPQSLEDHPLSQEEIERIRRNNDIPKGGLF